MVPLSRSGRPTPGLLADSLVVKFVQLRRAESRFAGWTAPLWILALVGILFIPTEYRGGAVSPHSHALLQLVLDAQDGQIIHTHAHQDAAFVALDWLNPEVPDTAADQVQAQLQPDIGQQQDRASTVSIISFLVMLPALLMLSGDLPRVAPAMPRLVGRSPRVLFPPPRTFVAA